MDFLINTSESRDKVIAYINRLPIEKRPYKARVEVVRKSRSSDQNSYMWYVFDLLAQEFGTDRYAIHDFFSHLFLRVIDRVGEHEYHRTRGTSKLSTTEHSEFMEQVRIWASVEHGIIVPLPGEVITDNLNF